ncbi:MAG: T9SS type A sorting domain-containing protein [Flavobacteriales bacterium]|nr:T9SS type A sorting domain-containing protein [Flavobacteriales bacterium]
MKRLFVILLLLTSICSANAQNWAPFPLDATSEWRTHRHWEGSGIGCDGYNQKSHYVGDTVIFQGHIFQEIHYVGMQWNNCSPWHGGELLHEISGVSGVMRAESGVYYRLVSGIESVIIDFSANVGDTVPNSSMIIDSMDIVNVNGASCKRLWLSNYHYYYSGHYPHWIIEGVGHLNGTILDEFELYYEEQQLCYLEDGMLATYDGSDISACWIVSVEEEPVQIPFHIIQNPSSGIYRIETSQTSSYRVYDLFGRIITQGQLNGTSELDLTSQPNGIYLISVETENGISTSKLVKQ